MKIAIIEFNLSLPTGSPRFALSVARALKKRNHDVVIFTTEFNRSFFPNLWKGLDIRIVQPSVSEINLRGAKTLWGKAWQRWQRKVVSIENAKKIVNLMDDDFDIINCHNTYTYRVGYFYKKKFHSKAKIIWTLHDVPWLYRHVGHLFHDLPRTLLSLIEEKAEKKFYQVVDEITLLESRNTEIALRMGFSPKQTHIIRGGVDFNKFFNPVKDINKTKQIIFLGIGSLHPYRRYEDIILATYHLAQKGVDIKSILVCRSSPGTENYKNKLLNLVAQKKIENRVIFMFNGVEEYSLHKILQTSHFYIFPDIIRIWGMSGVEAMTSGLVLVASRSTSFADVLVDRENVIFTQPGNPEDIASKVEWALENPKEYKRIALAGQQFVKENMTWEKYVEQLVKIFH